MSGWQDKISRLETQVPQAKGIFVAKLLGSATFPTWL